MEAGTVFTSILYEESSVATNGSFLLVCTVLLALTTSEAESILLPWGRALFMYECEANDSFSNGIWSLYRPGV